MTQTKILDDLKTDHDVFIYVRDHLLNQNQRSLDPWSLQCQYRSQTEDGKVLMCAIGCLIDDHSYSEKIENCSASNIDVKQSVANSITNWTVNTDMLLELQNIHDEYEHDEWSLKLDYFESYFSPIGEYVQAG
jgi:hypothetical protein